MAALLWMVALLSKGRGPQTLAALSKPSASRRVDCRPPCGGGELRQGRWSARSAPRGWLECVSLVGVECVLVGARGLEISDHRLQGRTSVLSGKAGIPIAVSSQAGRLPSRAMRSPGSAT